MQSQANHRVVARIASQEELVRQAKNVLWELVYLYHVLEEVIVQTLVVSYQDYAKQAITVFRYKIFNLVFLLSDIFYYLHNIACLELYYRYTYSIEVFEWHIDR